MTDRMTPEDRAKAIYVGHDVGAQEWQDGLIAIIAACIEECQRHAPMRTPEDDDWMCEWCDQLGSCDTYQNLSAPLLAAGVPEEELRHESTTS